MLVAYARIHSKGGDIELVTIVKRYTDVVYRVRTKDNIVCQAIWNVFQQILYADDIYTIVEEKEENV